VRRDDGGSTGSPCSFPFDKRRIAGKPLVGKDSKINGLIGRGDYTFSIQWGMKLIDAATEWVRPLPKASGSTEAT